MQDRPSSTSFRDNINGISVSIHMAEEDYARFKNIIRPTIVDRNSLMTATDVISVIPPGGDFKVDIDTPDVSEKDDVVKSAPLHVSFKAHWFTVEEKKAKTADGANTFGDSGTLEMIDAPSTIYIPVMDARCIDSAELASFGARLIPTNQVIKGFNTSPYPLPVVTYAVHADYASAYLFNADGGGGAFIERHVPPHVWVPLNPLCHGALILGKHDDADNDQYTVTAVRIPYGYALALDSNALHADSFLIGHYAMALSATDDKAANASTAVWRSKTDEIQPVELVDTHRTSSLKKNLALTSSYGSFFRKMHDQYLTDNRHSSDEAQREYDKRFGLIVRMNG